MSNEKSLFQLTEQVQDLKYQLEQKTSEYQTQTEKQQIKINEQAEKLKRMKEIFGQATKSIDNYRATIQTHLGELEQLKSELETVKKEKALVLKEREEEKVILQNLTQDKGDWVSQQEQGEKEKQVLRDELNQVQKEYEQYKKRAHKLLEKSKEQIDGKTRQAVDQAIKTLEAKHQAEQAQRSEQQLVLERDLRKSIDYISQLEASQAKLVKEKSQCELESGRSRQALAREQARHEAALAQAQEEQAKLKKAQAEALHSLQRQLGLLENENKRLKAVQEPVLPLPALADLERQRHELQLLLKDAQADNKLLRHQERMAKNELRKLNTADKKQNMNTEYLKNVLLKFFQSENKQTMVPIIAKLLSLDETETTQLYQRCV